MSLWSLNSSSNFSPFANIFTTGLSKLVAVNENEQGYKDVIYIPGNSTVRVIVKMTDFVDDNTGYMYHCHFLEHEDDGMMGQFTVTDGAAVVNVGGTSGGMGNGMNGMNGNSNSNQNQGNRR